MVGSGQHVESPEWGELEPRVGLEMQISPQKETREQNRHGREQPAGTGAGTEGAGDHVGKPGGGTWLGHLTAVSYMDAVGTAEGVMLMVKRKRGQLNVSVLLRPLRHDPGLSTSVLGLPVSRRR